MATAVTMPRLGLSMVEGTVVEWRVRPGDPIAKGALILSVASEKAEVEIEAFASGVLAAIYVDVGATVPIGTLLGAIAAPGEAFDAGAFAASFVPEAEGAPATAAGAGTGGATATGAAADRGRAAPGRATGAAGAASAPAARVAPGAAGAAAEPAGIKVAPAARALARRMGIDLATVGGTGPGGRITVEDVERAASGAVVPPVVEGAAPGVAVPRVVVVNGTGLAVATAGAGSPLLFVAGYGADASGWRLQVDELSGAYTVVTYDHRGVGDSWPNRAPGLSIATLAADAHALLTALGHAPAVIVGASMGAAVALELALAHAGTVRGLVLLAPILERDARFEAVLRAWCAYDAPQAETRIRSMLPWLFGRELLAHAGRREAAAVALRAMAGRTPAAVLREHAEALLAWLGTRTAELGRIAAPALVVAGSDDLLTPPAEAESVVCALPHARLEVLPGAGHALMIERADTVNALIRELASATAPR
jgi:pimeloyl-ACP methyl ester carboxylesterase